MLRLRVPAPALLLVLALTASLPATAAAQADISGAWEVTIDSPQGAMAIDADLKQDGEAVTGVITSPMGSVEIKGTLVKDALSFAYSVPLQGQSLEITMAGKVAGDTMDGIVAIAGVGEVPWKAKRKPAASAAADAVAPAAGASTAAPSGGAIGDGVSGKWDVLMETPGGQIPFTATLTQAGEKVSGSIASPMGELPVTGTMTGNALKLDMTITTPQGDLAVAMTGDLGPAGLTGKAITAMGEMTWSATRAK